MTAGDGKAGEAARSTAARRPRVVEAEAVAVAPSIVGQRLAAPWRRLAAMLLDLAFVGVLSLFGLALLLGAGAVAAGRAARRQPRLPGRIALACIAAFLAMLAIASLLRGRTDGSPVKILVDGKDTGVSAGEMLDALPEIVALGQARTDDEAGQLAQRLVEKLRAASGDPASVDAAIARIAEDADDPRVSAALARAMAGPGDDIPPALVRDLADALAAGDSARVAALRPAVAQVVAAPELRASRAEAGRLQQANEALDDELDAARRPPLRAMILGVADDLGLGFGWSLLYFTTLTTIWRGQTIGKRLLRIRVIRLDGKPITWWLAFNRTGGYAASLFTGMLGFAELLWDHNRQALHDRIAWTVVAEA